MKKLMMLGPMVLLTIGCSNLDLTAQSVDCRKVITCSNEGCIKHYRGNQCDPTERNTREVVPNRYW